MRNRWKSALSEGLVQLAVVLSLLRTDLRVYLRQYSNYPEVQQALLGQSVGLQVSDSYRNINNLPLLPSKYIDDTDSILNEVNRLIRSPQFSTYQPPQVISAAWLVTDDITGSHASTSNSPAADPLTEQDVELIESLWKEDFNLGFGRQGAFGIQPKDQDSDELDEYLTDEDSGDRMPVSESFPTNLDILDYEFVPVDHSPVFTTQTSLERALNELSTEEDNNNNNNNDAIINQLQDTNSTMVNPPDHTRTESDFMSGLQQTNDSGILWGGYQSQMDSLPRQDSMMNLTASLPLDNNDLFTDLNLGADPVDALDLDLDNDAMLSGYPPANLNPSRYMGNSEIRDSISEDSAVGSSPSYTWSDRASTSSAGERHSFSTEDYLDDLDEGVLEEDALDEGAVGGLTSCKTEPYDNSYFDYVSATGPSDLLEEFHELGEYEDEYMTETKYGAKNVVTHDHTYGAPYGGIPHVRKMDLKKPKVPSRGLAHDEMMCKKLKVRIPVETIINSPVDEFNQLCEERRLSAKQLNLVRDIRRRGKNKVAAQNCRQKKIGEYSELDVEVNALKKKRDSLSIKSNSLSKKHTDVRKHIDLMSTELFRTLRDENGLPYNTTRFSLEVGRDGEIHVTPTPTDQPSTSSRNTRRGNSGKKLDKKRRRQ